MTVSATAQPHLDLKAPPPLPEGGLRVIALGGLGEIGRNMAVLEFDGRLLVIDCGVLFPEAEQPGVDLILPDFGVIEHRLADVEAVVLTHGHEDHIGAIPYLLRLRGDIPLVGSRFTLALVAAKLREHRIDPVLVEVAAGDDHVAGPFHCEFVSVNHSIPDALAVAVHTPAGRPGAHRRLQDGPAAAGRRPHRPRLRSPGSAWRASTCCWPTPPTPRCRASSPPSGRSARCSRTSSAGPPSG